MRHGLNEQPIPVDRKSKGDTDAVALTRREKQVAGLLAQGLSNRAIADKLVISQRTVEGHVEKILVKLGYTSRTQIAAWFHQHPNV